MKGRRLAPELRGLIGKLVTSEDAYQAMLNERSGPTCAFCPYKKSGQCCFPSS